MLSYCLALCRIPARRERIYSQWRANCDVFLMVYVWFCCCVPHAYWIIKASVCATEAPDRLPFSDGINQDPAFRTFPCNPTGGEKKAGMPLILFNTFNSLINEPLQSTQWFYDNWWWATPCIFWSHAFYHGSAIMMFMPVSALLWLLFPSWWVHGGRTLTYLTWRTYTTTSVLAFELTEGRLRANPLEFDKAIQWKFHSTLAPIVLASVQPRLQLPFTVLEVLATSYLPIVVYWSMRPSLLWMLKVLACSVGSAALGLFIISVEHHILYKLTASWYPEEADTTPLGPIHALKSAWAGFKELYTIINATQQSVEFAVTAVVALVFVLVLAILDDLMLVL